MESFEKNRQYLKFCLYGFLKNLRFYDAFLLLFFLDNSLNYSQIGLLYAVREITTNLLEVPSGLLADAYGRKRSLLLAFLVYILAFLTFYSSANFFLLLIAMVLVGTGDAFRSGTHKGMIMDYLRIMGWESQKINYYGHTRSWSQLGSAVSALVAGLTVFYASNYRIIYLISITPYLLNFVNIYTYPSALDHPLKRKKQLRKGPVAMLKDLWFVLKQPQVLRIVNSAALHSAYLKSIKDYIQPLIVSLAVLLPFLSSMEIESRNGLVVGITYFLIFLLTSLASRNAGRVSEKKIPNIQNKTLFLGFVVGVLSGILFHYQLWLLSLLFFMVIYLIENVRKPILTGFLVDRVPNEILTSVISAQSFYQTLTTATLSIVLGVLADGVGVGLALAMMTGTLAVFTLFLGNRTSTPS
ncbi:MAG: MFS transporter [Saprospiraceae bacterium]|nr:MFS transporter [Saprospiraceae bacterium]